MVQTRHRVSVREALAGVQLMQAVGHRTTTAMKWPALQWYMSSCHHFHGRPTAPHPLCCSSA